MWKPSILFLRIAGSCATLAKIILKKLEKIRRTVLIESIKGALNATRMLRKIFTRINLKENSRWENAAQFPRKKTTVSQSRDQLKNLFSHLFHQWTKTKFRSVNSKHNLD